MIFQLTSVSVHRCVRPFVRPYHFDCPHSKCPHSYTYSQHTILFCRLGGASKYPKFNTGPPIFLKSITNGPSNDSDLLEPCSQ